MLTKYLQVPSPQETSKAHRSPGSATDVTLVLWNKKNPFHWNETGHILKIIIHVSVLLLPEFPL